MFIYIRGADINIFSHIYNFISMIQEQSETKEQTSAEQEVIKVNMPCFLLIFFG